ncbi:glycosyltransferase [Halobacillus ihumii]|uniref:glycosyltransferase n=1 Tax=Halobacillus ihumii TaxID=2686092 RepID=UPI0013D33DB3|nr:glycosyltransferase [Halobacillus ihumii]
MKKKLVHISEALGGGVSKHIIDLIDNIDTNKYDIFLIYNLDRADKSFKEKIVEYKKNRNISLYEVENFNRQISYKDVFALKNIFSIINKIQPDIVHCHSSKAGVLGRVSAKLAGVNKIFYTPHAYVMQDSNIKPIKNTLYKIIEKFMSRFFTTSTINVSNGEKKFALDNKLDNPDKFNVIYNGIDNNIKSEVVKTNKSKNKGIIIGVVGRLESQKDPLTFAQIAKEVSLQLSSVKFIFIGEGSLRPELEEFIKNNNLQNILLLPGYKSSVDEYLNLFDIYLSTSLYEGMPYSLIEALKYKLPIVGTDVIGNNEVIVNNHNGFLFDPGDYKKASELILHLLTNTETHTKMKKNSRFLFETTFTIKNMIDNLDNLYN